MDAPWWHRAVGVVLGGTAYRLGLGTWIWQHPDLALGVATLLLGVWLAPTAIIRVRP